MTRSKKSRGTNTQQVVYVYFVSVNRERTKKKKKKKKEKEKKKKNVVGALFIPFGEKVCEMSCKEDKHSVIVLKCTYREE